MPVDLNSVQWARQAKQMDLSLSYVCLNISYVSHGNAVMAEVGFWSDVQTILTMEQFRCF